MQLGCRDLTDFGHAELPVLAEYPLGLQLLETRVTTQANPVRPWLARRLPRPKLKPSDMTLLTRVSLASNHRHPVPGLEAPLSDPPPRAEAGLHHEVHRHLSAR
jgi:hypothetical protein